MEGLFEELGIGLELRDERFAGRSVETTFLGELTPEQAAAAAALLAHDTGVLAATTVFGKTVVAASLLAKRRANTLILVHRRQLMDQWIARLGAFLDLTDSQIGRIGGGKRKPTGVVDVAVIQGLVHGDEVDDLVRDRRPRALPEIERCWAVGGSDSGTGPIRRTRCDRPDYETRRARKFAA